MIMKPIKHVVLTSIFALTLGACVSFGGEAPPSLLVLTASNAVADGATKSGASSDALIVLLPEAPRKLDSNRVPVQIDDSSIAYLKDAVWADKPSRLMQLLLMETIAAKSGRLVLNETDAGGKASQYLSGSLLDFGIDAATQEAVVVYDAVRQIRGQSIEKKRFESRKSVTAVEAGPAGIALNDAANDVASQVSDWIG